MREHAAPAPASLRRLGGHLWLPVSGFVLCLPGSPFFTANVRSSHLSEAGRSCQAWWWFTCGCDAPVLRASPTGRWDPGLRGGSEDPRAGRRGAAVRTAPPRTSWSGCIGLRTPSPLPQGPVGPSPRGLWVCVREPRMVMRSWCFSGRKMQNRGPRGLLLLRRTPPV